MFLFLFLSFLYFLLFVTQRRAQEGETGNFTRCVSGALPFVKDEGTRSESRPQPTARTGPAQGKAVGRRSPLCAGHCPLRAEVASHCLCFVVEKEKQKKQREGSLLEMWWKEAEAATVSGRRR